MKKIISILAAIAIMSTSSPALIGGAESFDTTSYETVAMDVAGALAQPGWKDPAVGVTALRVKWNKVSGASGYRVYRLIGGKWTKVATLRGAGTTQYRDSGLDSATEYSYKVKAYRKTSHGTKWSKASAKLTATTKPKQVKLSSCGATETAIRLNWQATRCDGYLVYQKQSDGSFERIAKLNSSATTYRVDGLSEGTKYTFKMRAYKRTPSGLIFGSCASKTKTTKEKEIVWTDVDKAYYHMACGYPTDEQCELVSDDISNYILSKYGETLNARRNFDLWRIYAFASPSDECYNFNEHKFIAKKDVADKDKTDDAHRETSVELWYFADIEKSGDGFLPQKNAYNKQNYDAVQNMKKECYSTFTDYAFSSDAFGLPPLKQCSDFCFNIGIDKIPDGASWVDDDIDYYKDKDPYHIPMYILWFCDDGYASPHNIGEDSCISAEK